MTPQQFDLLVSNIRQDGGLLGTVLIYRDSILSGNHRTAAAIKAGIEEGDCVEILTEIDRERQLAIQLSQNAITGQDDPNILAKLFADVGTLGLRKYTGVTDDHLKVQADKLASLGITQPKYEELRIVFLPEDKAAFLDLMQRIQAEAEKNKCVDTIVGHAEDFAALFDVLVRVKQQRKIINNAVALRTMAEIAIGVLDQEKQSTETAATQKQPAA